MYVYFRCNSLVQNGLFAPLHHSKTKSSADASSRRTARSSSGSSRGYEHVTASRCIGSKACQQCLSQAGASCIHFLVCCILLTRSYSAPYVRQSVPPPAAPAAQGASATANLSVAAQMRAQLLAGTKRPAEQPAAAAGTAAESEVATVSEVSVVVAATTTEMTVVSDEAAPAASAGMCPCPCDAVDSSDVANNSKAREGRRGGR